MKKDLIVSIKDLAFGYAERQIHRKINMNFIEVKLLRSWEVVVWKNNNSPFNRWQIKPTSGQVEVDGKIVHEQGRKGFMSFAEKWDALSTWSPF